MYKKEFLFSSYNNIIFFTSVLSILLCGLQYGAGHFLGLSFYYSVLKMHLFLYILTIGLIATTFVVEKINDKFIGFSFLMMLMVRIILSIFFLWPLIKEDRRGEFEADILFFMISYFIFLIWDVFFIVKRVGYLGKLSGR